MYLGVVLHVHLGVYVTVKAVTYSASRALDLLIANYKSICGLVAIDYHSIYIQNCTIQLFGQ